MNALLACAFASEAAPDAVEAQPLDCIGLCGVVHGVTPQCELLQARKGTGEMHGPVSCAGDLVAAWAYLLRAHGGRESEAQRRKRRRAARLRPNLAFSAVVCTLLISQEKKLQARQLQYDLKYLKTKVPTCHNTNPPRALPPGVRYMGLLEKCGPPAGSTAPRPGLPRRPAASHRPVTRRWSRMWAGAPVAARVAAACIGRRRRRRQQRPWPSMLGGGCSTVVARPRCCAPCPEPPASRRRNAVVAAHAVAAGRDIVARRRAAAQRGAGAP